MTRTGYYSDVELQSFIRTYPGAMDDELIDDLIALPGARFMDESYRRCSLTSVDGEPLDRFRKVIRDCFEDYRQISTTLNFCTLIESPNILRYEPAGDEPQHFHEHADAWNIPSSTRQVSILAYLNDVDEGGETVFPHLGQSISCKKGLVALFPANFLYHHLAKEPESNTKIILVTWLHFGNDGTPTYRTSKLA